MSANDRQPGGTHYQGNSYQHWDWVAECRISYLEGCATKYIVRHKKKNKAQDLEKAIHFVEKIYELIDKGYKNRSLFMSLSMDSRHCSVLTDDFIIGADLDHNQATIVRLLMNWESSGDIAVTLNILRHYMLACYPVATKEQAQTLASATTAATLAAPTDALCGAGGGPVPGRRACTVCGTTLVGEVCPKVGCCQPEVIGKAPRLKWKKKAIDSRSPWGMEDPRGYEGDD